MCTSWGARLRRLGGALGERWAARALVALIIVYKVGFSWLFAGSCRFVPSCSAYGREAIEKYGALRGLAMTLRRISRCHPFHPGGFDPVR